MRTRLFQTRPSFMLNTPKDPSGGGAPPTPPPALTIEQQHAAAITDRDAARNSLATITAERDTLRADLASRTTERDTARNDLAARDTTLSAVRAELESARTESATRASRITALENALGAAGVNVNDLPKVPAAKPGKSDKEMSKADFDNLDAAEKMNFCKAGGKITD